MKDEVLLKKKRTPGLKYADMVNGNIPGNTFKIDPES